MAAAKTFKDLLVWKRAHQFVLMTYKHTAGFPKSEVYGLSSQFRRAAVSIAANIAEGYGRFHYQENIQFCRVARGSLIETFDHLTVALDECYIVQEKFDNLFKKYEELIKMINGYISYLKKRKVDG